MKELKDNELNAVNGGDNGDAERERSDTPEGVRFLYNVGDQVEFYISPIHDHTYTAIVMDRKAERYLDGCTPYYAGAYYLHFPGCQRREQWTSADHIEST